MARRPPRSRSACGKDGLGAPRFHRTARQALGAIALLCTTAWASAQAACAQITTWAQSDASSFPVPELSAVSVTPTPGPYYTLFGSGAVATQRVSLFSVTGYPQNQRARTFRNAVIVSLYSFADDTQAGIVFAQDVDYFLRSNPSNWRYELITTEGHPSSGAPLVYHKDWVDHRQLSAQRRHGNVILRIHLFSDSATETVLVQGVAELADRTRQALELVDRKCGVVPPLTGHGVAIEPDPSEGFAFHEQILDRRGFRIVFRDSHGSNHLDFSTFRLLVGGSAAQPGIDTTAHALGRLAQGIVPFTENAPDANTRVFHIVPDPAQLMKGHDIFAIPFNGDWRVELRICDKAQNCVAKAYTVYFGPFVRFGSASHARCDGGAQGAIGLRDIGIGNIGVDSPRTDVYLGLRTSDSSRLWTFHIGSTKQTGDTLILGWWQGRIAPYLPGLALPSGSWRGQREADFDTRYAFDLSTAPLPGGSEVVPLPAGNLTLIAAAVDTATGAYRRFEDVVRICP